MASKIAGDAEQDEVFVIGGSSVYAEAMPVATRLYLTLVQGEIEGDVYFPEIDLGDWVEAEKVNHRADESHAYPFSISQYVRKS